MLTNRIIIKATIIMINWRKNKKTKLMKLNKLIKNKLFNNNNNNLYNYNRMLNKILYKIIIICI